MPSIIIKEIDATTGGGAVSSTDIAYVPGFQALQDSAYPVDKDGNPDHSNAANSKEPTLCTTVAEFEKYFGKEPALFDSVITYADIVAVVDIATADVKGTDLFIGGSADDGKVYDPSYIYAKELLHNGIPVLYEAVKGIDDAESYSGDEFSANDIIALYEYLGDGVDGPFKRLQERGEFDVKYLTTGGYPNWDTRLSSYEYTVAGGGEVSTDPPYEGTASLPSDVTGVITVGPAAVYAIKSSGATATSVTYVSGNSGEPSSSQLEELGSVTGKMSITSTTGEGDPESGVYRVEEVDLEGKIHINTEDLYYTITLTNVEQNPFVEGSYYYFVVNSVTQPTTFYRAYKFGWHIDGGTDELTDSVAIVNASPAPGETFTITLSGEGTASFNTIPRVGRDCASTRGDAVFLLDTFNSQTRPLVGNGSFYEALKNWSQSGVTSYEYCSAIVPWVNIVTTQLVNNYTVAMPGSYAYLAALGNSIKTNANWLAVAGAARGAIPGLDTSSPFTINKTLTNSIAENEYQNRDGVSINAITNIKPFGYRIWGNRTLKNNSKESNLTATSFLNLRNLVSDVKKIVYQACRKYTFEQNNDVLWTNFKAYIEPTLERMRTGAGISGYKIIKGVTTEKAKLVATIKLYPVYAVEDFDITVRLEDDEISVQ